MTSSFFALNHVLITAQFREWLGRYTDKYGFATYYKTNS